MNKQPDSFGKSIFYTLTFISILIFHAQANSQQNNIIDEVMESIKERNKKYGEESSKNAIEAQRKIFINQGLSEEQIFLNKFKDELYEIYKSQHQKSLIDGGVKSSQASKFLKDFSDELFKCQKKYWETMPEILRKHAILLSKNGIMPLKATSMAQEDYKKRIIANGELEKIYTEQISKWGREHRVCVNSIEIKIENYLQ
jgi:hypothetical protein